MVRESMKDMNEKYQNKPTRKSEYLINGNLYVVNSHFVGNKNLNETLYRIAFRRALTESL